MVNTMQNIKGFIAAPFLAAFVLIGCSEKNKGNLQVHNNYHIVLIGKNLASRMLNFGHFETEMHLRYPDST